MTRPTFSLTLTALPEHIDELGHVNNAVWVQWIQQVALAHWYSVADPAHADDQDAGHQALPSSVEGAAPQSMQRSSTIASP